MDSFLENTFLSKIIFDKKELIQINSEATLEELNKILVKYNILSVPVYDEQKKQYIGFIGFNSINLIE